MCNHQDFLKYRHVKDQKQRKRIQKLHKESKLGKTHNKTHKYAQTENKLIIK